MRVLTVAAFVCLALAASASAQTADAELMAPIQKFIDSFNDSRLSSARTSSGPPRGWLIHAWTWTGPRPQPAAAPSKK